MGVEIYHSPVGVPEKKKIPLNYRRVQYCDKHVALVSNGTDFQWNL